MTRRKGANGSAATESGAPAAAAAAAAPGPASAPPKPKRVRTKAASTSARQKAGAAGAAAGAAGEAAPEPVPFWHGKLWEPLPLARWTRWTTTDENGAVTRTLNETIREERARLRELPGKYLPFLRSLRDGIRHLIADGLQEPHHRVFRVHHERLVLELQDRIEELEANKDLEDFERNVQPFIIAHANALAAAAREQEEASRGAPTLPPAIIDAMAPVQQRLYRRMLRMVAASSAAGAAGGGASLPHVVGNEELVRHMFSRLWVTAHAPASMHTSAHDVCQRCRVPMVKSTREQMLVCSQCGFSITYVDSTEAARTYGDDAEYYPNASTRFNHFQEFVTRVQSRELKPVPRGIMTRVAVALRDTEGVTCAADITLDKVVRVVNALGAPLREYKKNVVQICAQLSGRWPVQLTAEQMFMARSIFFEILNAFEVLFPGDKKKWFRYKFIMRVICCTMGWDEMLGALDAIEGAGAAEEPDEAAGPPTALPLAKGGGGAEHASGGPGEADADAAEPTAALPAFLHNVPRAEIEDAELRMRAIFRHLGWQYRGPCTGIVEEEAAPPVKPGSVVMQTVPA
jgi:hypothetical protein